MIDVVNTINDVGNIMEVYSLHNVRRVVEQYKLASFEYMHLEKIRAV